MGYVMDGQYEPQLGSWLSKTIKRNSSVIGTVAPIAAGLIPGVGILAAPAVKAALTAYNGQQAAAEVKKLSRDQAAAAANTPPAGWDEASYLAANPDVAAAVKSGGFKSGWAHYVLNGANENRPLKPAASAAPIPTAPAWWNEARYLADHPGLPAKIQAGQFASGWAQFQQVGQTNPANPSWPWIRAAQAGIPQAMAFTSATASAASTTASSSSAAGGTSPLVWVGIAAAALLVLQKKGRK